MPEFFSITHNPENDTHRDVGSWTTPDYVWRVVGAHMYLYAGTRLKDAVVSKVGTTTYSISIPQNPKCKAFITASIQGSVNALADTEWFLVEDVWPSSYFARAAGQIKESLCNSDALAKAGSSDVKKELHLKWGSKELDIPVKTRGGPDPEISLLPTCTNKTMEVGAGGLSIVVAATGALTDTVSLGLGSGHALSHVEIEHTASIYGYYQCDKRVVPLFKYQTGKAFELYEDYDDMAKKANQGEAPNPSKQVSLKDAHPEQQYLAAITDLKHDIGALLDLQQDGITQGIFDYAIGTRRLNLRSTDFSSMDRAELSAQYDSYKEEVKRREDRARRVLQALDGPIEVFDAAKGR